MFEELDDHNAQCDYARHDENVNIHKRNQYEHVSV